MDANNLNQRLERIYQSLLLLKNNDLSILKVRTGNSENLDYIHVDFNNGKTEAELKNSVFLLIANIASIKDHLKNHCDRSGITLDVENIINTNKTNVAIVHDLWNIDKHPRYTGKRSGFLPKIINLQQVLQTSAGNEAGGYAIFTCDPITGEMRTETGGVELLSLLLMVKL